MFLFDFEDLRKDVRLYSSQMFHFLHKIAANFVRLRFAVAQIDYSGFIRAWLLITASAAAESFKTQQNDNLRGWNMKIYGFY